MNRFRGVRANLHLHVNLHFGVFSDFIFFWFKLTNFYFQSPNQKFGFSACCVWVGKGICPGQKLVIRWFFVCFKTFFPVIIRFVEVESCRELCSFKWWCFFFFPPREFEQPRSVSALLFLGGSLFYFSRCGGWEPHSPARRSLPALLYKRKQMDPC